MRFTVATYNIHKGFTQLNRRMVIHELRERLHGLAADILFLQEVVGVHRAARGAPRRLAGEAAARVHRRHASGTKSPTARTRSTATGITATRCCRASRSSRTRTSTSRRTRSRAAGCSIARSSSGRASPTLHCINVHLGLFERGRQWQIRALCERIRGDGARRTRRWSSPATSTTGGTRRTGCWSTSSACDEVFAAVRGRPARTFPVGAAGLPPRPHLRARPRDRRRARALRVPIGRGCPTTPRWRPRSRPARRAR